MLRSLSLFFIAQWGAQAMAEAPSLVASPLQSSQNISKKISRGYEAQLRGRLAKLCELLPVQKTKAAIEGLKIPCKKQTCIEKLANKTQARFSFGAWISNNDDIYEVKLLLYDRALKKMKEVKELCELCAAEEVKQTIRSALTRLEPELAAPAPPALKKSSVSVQVASKPKGAQVFLNGKRLGLSPLIFKVAPGRHILKLEKKGYKLEERPISAMDKPVKLSFTLKKPKPKPASAPLSQPVVQDEDPIIPPVAAAPRKSLAPMAWGLNLGGVLLASVGIWLIQLDGEITCDDGRSRTECPNVYNTKNLGASSLGIGAGLLGAGITALILDPGSGPGPYSSIVPSEGGASLRFSIPF